VNIPALFLIKPTSKKEVNFMKQSEFEIKKARILNRKFDDLWFIIGMSKGTRMDYFGRLGEQDAKELCQQFIDELAEIDTSAIPKQTKKYLQDNMKSLAEKIDYVFGTQFCKNINR
jgi:ubiquitin C-terminal hydrolase